MAEETISTRIVANADFSSLIADVHRVTSSLSKLQQELASSNKMLANQIAVMNRSFSDTLRSTGQYSSHFVSLQSDVEKFGKNLDGGKLKLNQYFNTFRQHAQQSGGLIRDLAKQQVALQNSILQPLGRNAQGLMQFNVHVPRGLDEIKNKTAIARQELQIMNKVIQDGAGQLINWGKNTQWAGRQLTVGLTVPLVAFGAQAAKAFREADQELVRLTKVYGDVAGTSAAELGRVRDDVAKTAKEISAAMGVSFKETIGLAADIAATGKTGDELLGSIKETTRLAVLGEVDRQEAMKATLAIQSAFKQNTEELTQSINFLNAVENQTSTTLNDLVEAIPKAGPVIQGLGGSVQDLALYLTAMREGGINAAEGANALKSALASLINPTDVAVGKFEALGIDLLSIVNDNAGNLTGTLMELQGALDRLNPLQKQQAIEQLFGKFQFSRLNALFENLGRQGSQTLQVLDLMKASTSDLASVADRELAAVTESASGKYRRAIESLRASLAEVGEQFLQINTVLITVIDKVVQFANNLPGPVKQVLALAGGFTAVIGPVIMLTGVLANFFGYILKGIFHMKAFFKGGEGWKYLTPEMLAAEKAGRLVEQTFYSDAKAAAVLKQALGNLIDEFSILEAKAKSGATSVNPSVSTMAGNLIIAAGGQRTVNPQHHLAGEEGTRASSHMVPRSGMTEAQKLQQTMFGMVPGSIKVNQKIGQNPQIYMNEDLPNVPGLTTIKGVSTGIVSGEAARWHAMMATLGMQSKAEIEALKKTITATQTVSKEFMMQFDDILPAVNVLTNNAATESALIVAELRAGKINLDAARAKIVALNLETERLIAATVQAQATAMGRTINPTMIPTLNQPVVGPTGKSNMRELFKKGKTKDFINKVAESLGVRTSGAGYNIETTIPKKMNTGGKVFYNNGDQVPGSGNTDTVPAMLTPGEFVIRKGVAQQDPEGMRALNDGQAMIVPVQNRNVGGIINVLRAYSARSKSLSGLRTGLRSDGRPGRSARNVNSPESFSYEAYSRNRIPGAGLSTLLNSGAVTAEEVALLRGMVGAHGSGRDFQRATGLRSRSGAYPSTNVGNVPNIFSNLSGSYTPTGRSRSSFQKESELDAQLLPGNMVHAPGGFNTSMSGAGASKTALGTVQGFQMTNLLDFLTSRGVSGADARRIANSAANRLNRALPREGITEDVWAKSIQRAEQGALVEHQALLSGIRLNYGGMVPGYMGGGGIKMPPWIVRNNAIQNLANTDPLHGPLQIGKYRPPLSIRNRRQGASISYGGNYRPYTWDKGPRAGETIWTPGRSSSVQAFLTGSQEERGRYVTEEYMRGNYSVLSIPGATEAMKAFNKKTSGTFHRGITLNGWSKVGGQMPPLPQWLMQDIKTAQATGNFSNLVGKEFIMRRSSWSSNAETAKGFGDFQLSADVKNRNVTPASKMFPELDFMSPGANVKVNESESIFGGKFRIVGAGPNGLKIETVSGPMGGRRAMGGSVSSGMPYVVGENGPEVFVPRNSGGIIPNIKGYKNGGDVVGSGMAASFGGMGLMAAGSMVGGGAGQVMSSAGMAMTFMPMLQMIPKVNKLMDLMKVRMGALNVGATKLSDSLGKKASSLTGLSKGFGPVLRGLAFLAKGFGPVGLAITGTILAVKGLTKLYKDHQEELRVNRLEYGMSSEVIKKAGYSMTNYNDSVKNAIEDAKALQERNKMIYESMFQANIPIKMTIAEYKKLREETKEKMPDLIELFNQKGNSEVAGVATKLKAQFMSLGDNVETATAKVYALMAQSNKAQLAAGAIGTKGFASIKTAVDAAVASAASFDDAMAKGDSKAATDSLLIAFEGIGNAIEDNAKTNKIEFSESMDQVLKKMATTGKGQVKINQDVLNELKKQNPELAKILNSTDTATSAWAKYQLALQGVNLDLKNLSGEAANAALKLQSLVVSNTTATLKNTAGIKDQYAKYEGLQKRIKDLQKASQGQSAKQQIDSRKVIEGLNEQIKKIKDAADAKIKALRSQSQAENDNLELQKLQLEYQEAIARGDQDAAARSQIAIQQLTNQVQTKKAEDAIIAKAELEIKPLQEQIDKLGKKNQELADKAALAGESLSKLQSEASGLKDKLGNLEKALSSAVFNKLIMGDKYEGSDQQKTDLAATEQGRRDLGMPKSVVTVTGGSHPKSTVKSRTTVLDVPGGAKDLTDSMVKQMSVQAGVVNLMGEIKMAGGAAPAGGYNKSFPKTIAANSSYKTKDGGILDDNAKRAILLANPDLAAGSFFEYGGKKYKVENVARGNYQGTPYISSMSVVAQRSLGGPVTPGRKYLVNDRMNSLGIQPEIFMPTMPGVIKPNIDTAFNIPSQQNVKMPSISNSPNSNNVYNIDIELNGTNITVDDVMKSMEAKMKLVGATLGRPVNVGGKY